MRRERREHLQLLVQLRQLPLPLRKFRDIAGDGDDARLPCVVAEPEFAHEEDALRAIGRDELLDERGFPCRERLAIRSSMRST